VNLTPTILELNLSEVEKRVTRFIKEYVEKTRTTGIVLGLSGGVDSNTIAALSSLSVGGDRVLGLLLPEQETFSEFLRDNPNLRRERQALQRKYKSKSQNDPALLLR
jgi:NH3-dependent NAD+ synthetase